MKCVPLVAVLVVSLLLASCGGSAEAPDSVALFCARPSPSFIADIEEGLTVGGGGGSLANAWYITAPSRLQNSAGWPEWLVAADLQGSGLEGDEDVAVWATGAAEGPVLAVDETAREFSDWGAAAQPGSPARAAIDDLRSSSEYEDVYDCVAG